MLIKLTILRLIPQTMLARSIKLKIQIIQKSMIPMPILKIIQKQISLTITTVEKLIIPETMVQKLIIQRSIATSAMEQRIIILKTIRMVIKETEHFSPRDFFVKLANQNLLYL